MKRDLDDFDEIWFGDFEFRALAGDCPSPITFFAKELKSGRCIDCWLDGSRNPEPPFTLGSTKLFVSYYASAEVGCFEVLHWPLPVNVLDLFIEFRARTNALNFNTKANILHALMYFGIDAVDSVVKDSMRQLAIRGGPWTGEEVRALRNYCRSDVIALERLYEVMKDSIDLPRAMHRGRFMKAAAKIEINGVPINVPVLSELRKYWSGIQTRLITKIDAETNIYDGTIFKVNRWDAWTRAQGIAWPRLPSGKLSLDSETFERMSILYPQVQPIRALRETISKLKLEDLTVGRDGRNRFILSAFRSKTGRNQPSNSQCIFGPAVWLRSLIKPEPGYGIAYIDWNQQEFGIAAKLSGDLIMQEAYATGDPYLAFARQAGAVPSGATKQSHRAIREVYKQCVLAVQYGMGSASLAQRIGKSEDEAKLLLEHHRRVFCKFWQWSDATVEYAMAHNELYTVFGWPIHITSSDINHRSLRNFLMQANGAEMLRLACCLATERGIKICAPVHDAILIEAPLEAIEDVVDETRDVMEEASSIILEKFKLRSDAKLFRYPDHYHDERGEQMWGTVLEILEEFGCLNSEQAATHV